MLNHVLIPLDGSSIAEEAIPAAKKLLASNGKITLVTSIDIPEHWTYGVHPIVSFGEYRQLIDDLLPEGKTYLQTIGKALLAEGFTVDIGAQFGDAANFILDTAAAQHVDAIVMTTHGRTGFSRLVFGSVTNKVLGAASCPVFVVPSKEHVQQITHAEPAVEHQ